jgi:hypothetical protein
MRLLGDAEAAARAKTLQARMGIGEPLETVDLQRSPQGKPV